MLGAQRRDRNALVKVIPLDIVPLYAAYIWGDDVVILELSLRARPDAGATQHEQVFEQRRRDRRHVRVEPKDPVVVCSESGSKKDRSNFGKEGAVSRSRQHELGTF